MNTWYNLKHFLLLGTILLLTGITGYPQGMLPVNNIQQDTALYNVFHAFATADNQVISILHLGDSHIQAGYFPLTTATLLQQQFGCAGRGYVFPYNLAGTNGPDDYRWSSTAKWQSQRMVDRIKPTLLGPGGIAVNSNNNTPILTYNSKPNGAFCNEVRKVKLLFDAGNVDKTVTVPNAQATVTAIPFPLLPGLAMATFNLLDTAHSFQVIPKSSGPFRFYGAVIENGQNGILYNSIGVNGAMYQQYNDASNILIAQMMVLQPRLVIISLGTNEANGRLDPLAFRSEVDSTIQLIRKLDPSVNILLTTPPDCMRMMQKITRKKIARGKYKTNYHTVYYPNPNIAMVTQQLAGYARQHGIACWNFNAVYKAQKNKFAGTWAPDHIHFNARGYQLQGQLLYEALYQSYLHFLHQIKQNPVTISND